MSHIYDLYNFNKLQACKPFNLMEVVNYDKTG